MTRPRGRPKTEPDRQSVHVRLPRDLHAELLARSARTGAPVNALIVRLLRAALATPE